MGQQPAVRGKPHIHSLTLSRSLSTPRLPEAAILITPIPPRWLLFHRGAWSGPPGGTLGHRCGEPFSGDAKTIFNFPRLCAGPPGKHGDSQEMASGLQGLEEPPAQAVARGRGGHQVPSRILLLSSLLPPTLFCWIRSPWLVKMEDGALGPEDKVSTPNSVKISRSLCPQDGSQPGVTLRSNDRIF